jgi:hypothetical protein
VPFCFEIPGLFRRASGEFFEQTAVIPYYSPVRGNLRFPRPKVLGSRLRCDSKEHSGDHGASNVRSSGAGEFFAKLGQGDDFSARHFADQGVDIDGPRDQHCSFSELLPHFRGDRDDSRFMRTLQFLAPAFSRLHVCYDATS